MLVHINSFINVICMQIAKVGNLSEYQLNEDLSWSLKRFVILKPYISIQRKRTISFAIYLFVLK